jgi:bla regulator protein blaR1
MLVWMIYVIVITLLLSGAALAAERTARLRRARTRWIWAATIVASLVIPTMIASVSIQVPSLSTPTVSRKAIPLRDLTSVQLVPLPWVHEHVANIVSTRGENRVLQHTWITVSAALLAALVINGLQLRWRKQRWRMGMVAGVSVYIAPDVGPAVVGLFRPRIVVPDWLLEASASRQVMVLTHEQSHLAAHDPQLLTVALFLLVLMPWNLPLWWQLHRLRYAIEVDCDARVLKAGLDAGEYSETLIDVSQRPSGYTGSVAAMSESRSFLEERITIMVTDRTKWRSLVVVMFGCVSVALLAVAAQVTPPNVGSSGSEPQPVTVTADILDHYVGSYLRGANIIYHITREGDHLLLNLPGYPPLTLVAKDEKTFVYVEASTFLDTIEPANNRISVTFASDASGQTTGLVTRYGPFFGVSFSVPCRRIDVSAADIIKTNNELRARSRTPVPGSGAALRRLIEGIIADKPNYDEMTPWYAELVREAGSITRAFYAPRGAVRSIGFIDVDEDGGDVYEVRQEAGFSTWIIFLNANGVIEDAADNPGRR